MKTAGVVFDFYDDVYQTHLKNIRVDTGTLRDIVKQAHILSPEERNILRDEAYALVMSNEGTILRKFACVDAGNTVLSMLYFDQTADRLPIEAVKVAAANLAKAAEEFGIPTTNLVKQAAATMITRRDPADPKDINDSNDFGQRTNLYQYLAAGQQSGRVMDALPTLKTASQKSAESAQGGMTLHNMKRDVPHTARQPDLQTTRKIPDPNVVGKHWEPQTNDLMMYKMPAVVDVSGKSPESQKVKKTASIHALGNRYPLDSYSDVKKAVDYFEEYWTNFNPEDRHEYCVKVASRAEDLGIPITDKIERYGSQKYAHDVSGHLMLRSRMSDPTWSEVYESMLEKRAEIDPESFARLLDQADRASGLHVQWGGKIADPYFSVFGGGSEKVASAEWSWEDGNRSLTYDQLQDLAQNADKMKGTFDDNLVEAFRVDPTTIFDSLPATTKSIIADMAE